MKSPFPVSDHCDGWRFFNPPGGAKERSLLELPKWWWQRRVHGLRANWPVQAATPRLPALPATIPPGKLAVTFIGHSTFLLQGAGFSLLTDPIFSSHAGPGGRFGVERTRPPALSLAQLPRIDGVLLSHNHYDHLDLSALRWLWHHHRPKVITTLGNQRWLQGRGIPDVVELDWWQSHWTSSLEVTCTPAKHFAARTPWDRNRTLWGGFAITTPAGSFYFAGDSGWTERFAEIGTRLGPFHLSLIPIGAYDPRWFMAAIHMNPEEAVRAHLAVRSRRSLGMHFGTFQLTDEAIDAPLIALAEARAKHQIAQADFDVLGFGETRWFP